MSRGEEPVRAVLREPHEEARARRNWDAIERRRAAKRLPSLAPAWGPRVAIGIAAAAAIVVAFVLSRSPTEPGAPALATPAPAIPSGEIHGDELVLEDGSRVTIQPEARLEILESGDDRIRFWLRAGGARFDVVPGGPRRWIIESGVVTVEVLGTAFTVEHAGDRVRVAVERGIVLVRGTTVPEGLRRLGAGEAIDVAAIASASAAPQSPPQMPEATALEATAPREVRRRAAAPEAPAPIEPDPVAEAEEVAPAPEPVAPARDARFRDVDALRAAGRSDEAIALLVEIADDAGAGRDRGVAAFTRARLELDRRHRARDAAVAFRQAIALGLPASLLEDARARRVEALSRVPDPLAAREAADEYLEHHRGGRWEAQVLRWSGQR